LIRGLYHYPIKGLSGQALPAVTVSEGQTFPHDREFALARPGGPITRDDPKWAKKGLFVMLMLDESLAEVQTHLDVETLNFTVSDRKEALLSVNLDNIDGRSGVEMFFQALVPKLSKPPMLVRSPGSHFMDKPDNVISLINLATVKNLESLWNAKINPLRFRANIYVDTGRPWEEFDWVGSTICLGEATLYVDRRNGRCAATNVDPETGARDMNIPMLLRAGFGHKDLGVYLTVRQGGTIVVGDQLIRPTESLAVQTVDVHPPSTADNEQRFICRGCYFIYSETEGLPKNNVAAGTRFDELPSGWCCPDCGTDVSNFRAYSALNDNSARRS
jgi:GntR family transcriptional regulator/MocR family aminotransferase